MEVQKETQAENSGAAVPSEPAQPAAAPATGDSTAPMSHEDYEKLLDQYDVSFRSLAEG
jgi:hypothetical protein